MYCSLEELEHDLGQDEGVKDVTRALERIRSASDWIDKRLGHFIPVSATRRYDGNGKISLPIHSLLSSTPTVTDDGDTLESTDFLLYPRNKLWENGPYSRIAIDPDATGITVWTPELDCVTVNGTWGLYDESIDVGTDLNDASFTSTKTALAVDDGSCLSPGMVILLDSEQMLVEDYGALTDSIANTAEAVDASEVEIDVNDGTQVNVGEIIKINFEQMKVLDISTNTLLVSRGYHNTSKTTHNTSVDVYVYRTFTVKRGINGTTAAAHDNDKDISRYIAPYDVNYLCRQMAVLMEKKAQTGFAGKTANVELGEVFYHQEFPKEVIDRIKRVYRIPRL